MRTALAVLAPLFHAVSLAACAADPTTAIVDDPFSSGKTDDAQCTSGEWSILTLDTKDDVGSSAVVVLDSNDRSHVLYREASYRELKYATNTSGSWSIEKVASSSDQRFDSPYLALAIDRDDTLHAVYGNYTADRGLYYRSRGRADTRWSAPVKIDALSTSIARDLGIAVDTRGGVHVVYHAFHDQMIKYAYRAPSAAGFVRQTLAGRYGWYPSIAVDHDDGIHIAFSGDNQHRPRYFHKPTGGILVEVPVATTDSPDRVGVGTALAVDSENGIHLAYSYRDAPDNVKHTTRPDGGAWTTPQAIATARSGVYAFALDPLTDAPTFVYEEPETNALHYADPDGDEVVDGVAPARMRASLQVDHSGVVHLPVYDPVAKDLKYARRCP